MLKRVGLFLLTNFLVIITVSLIMMVVLPMLGINPRGYYGLAVFSGVFGMTGAFISLAISRWVAKRAYNIQIITGNEPQHELREMYQMVAGLARKAKLPEVPEVGVYHSDEINAFATGPSKSKSLVAFSTGLLRSMDRKEVEAVAGHEISHIANGDMVTMTLLTGVVNALVIFVSRIVANLLDSFLRGDDGEGGLGFIGYIATVWILESVFMIFASIPIAAFSRYREFRADAGSARITSPHSMASALRAIARGASIETPRDSYAVAKISSGRRVSLWSTHPSLEDRIARLERM